ncbi:uncharacterized protein B0H18DRAFT_1113952 [Fomitopsis serialis]|uniref:uncharacterized protein n=1 Tax=Fomitopsis serialis TaxID=139415 RepID=UPI0020082B20|nr:uncharacterized protein B0H18DRAFT_1113952 [Neoantrodia serialis]KAH9936578.1 hypothetical protein B0H18DRAFT_1113952 [Neoantrodia serialis]
MLPPPQPPQEATDIFSISDQVLADRLQFIEEIGFGNWGSVWLCRPKPDPASPSLDNPDSLRDTRIAVKLVHRSKTSTTAARVRSLWNEMKVVRSLKHQPHPSIIPFYSFIITPSYALITMAYHPRLVPVEVPEKHSKPWFRSLLSGVEFLHKRGVVHNDIKPANILMSEEHVPVLVDFGFAERYDIESSKAFHSNLSYGTPEYLSPERARGMPHDTRKSDVWALGVTIFEILMGRTPFEYSEGEHFTTKEDLERYWNRTLRGKWVGTWKMSRGLEKLLRRMVLPNADLRCTASQAMEDEYWVHKEAPPPSHRKGASVSHAPSLSLGLEKDVFKFSDIISTWSPRSVAENIKEKDRESEKEREKEKHRRERAKKRDADKENGAAERGHVGAQESEEAKPERRASRSRHARTQSQPKLLVSEARVVNQAKNGVMPSLLDTLSPIKASPPATPTVFSSVLGAGKENVSPAPSGNSKSARTTRKPLGPRGPTPPTSPVVASLPLSPSGKENAASAPLAKQREKEARRSRVFKDVTAVNRNAENAAEIVTPKRPAKSPESHSNSVRDRMKAWERERERLREMELLEERVNEVDEERERQTREEEEIEEEVEEEAQKEERELEKATSEERLKAQEEQHQAHLEAERQRELDLARDKANGRERGRGQQRDRGHNLPRLNLLRGTSISPPDSLPPTPLSPLKEEESEPPMSPQGEYPGIGNESGISLFKHGLRMSIDKTMRLYKSSTMALGRSTPALQLLIDDEDDISRMSVSERESWEDDDLVHRELNDAAKSSLPVVRHAVRNEELAAANKLDRMTIWVRNVERVVEDARQTFAESSTSGPLPALPLAPVSRRTSLSRSQRSAGRIPRKILAANQIFTDEYESGFLDQTAQSFDRSQGSSFFADKKEEPKSPNNINEDTLPTIPSEQPSILSNNQSLVVPETPSRRRRATVVTRSPEPARKKPSLEIDTSPSKRREKSRSQNDLIRPITPVTKLEFELQKLATPAPPQRLSAMVDRSIFISPSPSTGPQEVLAAQDRSHDELTASPFHVEPYPPRRQSVQIDAPLDTPGRKHLDDIYDRFLMSTAGVKRVGKGYQSQTAAVPVSNIPVHMATHAKRNQHFFRSTRRPMPPPVSSDDLRRAASIDEFGVVMRAAGAHDRSPDPFDQSKNTVAIVRKAFKAIVSGKPMSTKSRVVMP